MITMHKLYKKYGGRCIYCLHLVWTDTRCLGFDALWQQQCKEAIAKEQDYDCFRDIPKGMRRRLRATREHLIRLVDGGTDDAENIALACLGCNSTREARSVEEHKHAIQNKHKRDWLHKYATAT